MSFNGSGTYSLYTPGNPVVSGSTIDPNWAINTLNDIATALSSCVVKDGQQATTAVVPFAAGISVSGGSTLSTYALGSTASTFTFDGAGGTSGSVTLTWQKIGNFVTINIPGFSATTGVGSTLATSNTAISATARPTNTQDCPIMQVLNNGVVVGPAGYLRVNTDGTFTLFRDAAATAFTNAAVAGLNRGASITYFTG